MFMKVSNLFKMFMKASKLFDMFMNVSKLFKIFMEVFKMFMKLSKLKLFRTQWASLTGEMGRLREDFVLVNRNQPLLVFLFSFP